MTIGKRRTGERWRQALRRVFGCGAVGIAFTLSAAIQAGPALAGDGVASAVASVGEVTLSIGASEVQREGKAHSIAKGGEILPGDVIRTSASGHVHIRFADGALVSVRPQSVLHVQEYRYDAARPADSLVKFYLETGTVREISGQAAQLAKEKFRLNTPLVAIGVRGTDFITQVNAQSTAVLVNQGAIVLTPLDGACTASGFGPCETPRSRELADTMNGMALVYRQSASEPVLQPVHTLKGVERVTPMLQQKHNGDAGIGDVVNDAKNPEAVLDVVKPSRSLTWGRWARNTMPGDSLTVPFAEAMEGKRVTVGDGYYFLFRDEGVPHLLQSMSGVTHFRLQGGAAQYRAVSNEVSAATVEGGTLGIDFTRNTFTTQLSVGVPGSGSQSVAASGAIDRNTGIFLSSRDNKDTRVAGAVSLDANQAGYLFTKAIGGAAISGATLWSR